MATRTVRVIRVWEKEVDAEYGDTDQSLLDRVEEGWLDANAPQAETRVILEAAESDYDTRQQLTCPDCKPGKSCSEHATDPYAEPAAAPAAADLGGQ